MTAELQTRPSQKNQTPGLQPADRELEPSVLSGLLNLWNLRSLTKLMVERDFVGRYKGSLLGALWPVLNPLGHMILYTFLFSMILKVRFGDSASTSNFALYLMCGLLPWTAMAEAIASSTTKILEMPNLVKRVVFPLEILPLVSTISAFTSGIISILLLCVVACIFTQSVPWTLLLIPIVLVPQFLFALGISWLLASLGVFVRDSKHIVALGLSAWMYATPVVYPSEMLPENFKWLLTANPVAGMINDYRRLIIEGSLPELVPYLTYTGISVIMCYIGFSFFYKTKKSFADVM